jgi:hypothetical protein
MEHPEHAVSRKRFDPYTKFGCILTTTSRRSGSGRLISPHMRVSQLSVLEDKCRILTELSHFSMQPFLSSSHYITVPTSELTVYSSYELGVLNALHCGDLLYFIPTFTRNYPSTSLHSFAIALQSQSQNHNTLYHFE